MANCSNGHHKSIRLRRNIFALKMLCYFQHLRKGSNEFSPFRAIAIERVGIGNWRKDTVPMLSPPSRAGEPRKVSSKKSSFARNRFASLPAASNRSPFWRNLSKVLSRCPSRPATETDKNSDEVTAYMVYRDNPLTTKALHMPAGLGEPFLPGQGEKFTRHIGSAQPCKYHVVTTMDLGHLRHREIRDFALS